MTCKICTWFIEPALWKIQRIILFIMFSTVKIINKIWSSRKNKTVNKMHPIEQQVGNVADCFQERCRDKLLSPFENGHVCFFGGGLVWCHMIVPETHSQPLFASVLWTAETLSLILTGSGGATWWYHPHLLNEPFSILYPLYILLIHGIMCVHFYLFRHIHVFIFWYYIYLMLNILECVYEFILLFFPSIQC